MSIDRPGWQNPILFERTYNRMGHEVVRYIPEDERRQRAFDEMRKYYRLVDGRYWVMKNIIYVCPSCGRTVKQPAISYYTVDTICGCEYPQLNKMVRVPMDEGGG